MILCFIFTTQIGNDNVVQRQNKTARPEQKHCWQQWRVLNVNWEKTRVTVCTFSLRSNKSGGRAKSDGAICFQSETKRQCGSCCTDYIFHKVNKTWRQRPDRKMTKEWNSVNCSDIVHGYYKTYWRGHEVTQKTGYELLQLVWYFGKMVLICVLIESEMKKLAAPRWAAQSTVNKICPSS